MNAPPLNPVQDNGLDAPRVQAEPCAAWYGAHGKAVYNYFRFQLVPPDDAEDFTAETFLRAVRAATATTPRGRCNSDGDSRNVLTDERRRGRRQVGVDELRTATMKPSPESDARRRRLAP
jgi:DNA-directed RNA polymerase specialized sigma24 family protein